MKKQKSGKLSAEDKKLAKIFYIPAGKSKGLAKIFKELADKQERRDKLIKKGLKRMRTTELWALHDLLKGNTGVEKSLVVGWISEILVYKKP